MGAAARRVPAVARRAGPVRDAAVAGATATAGVGTVLMGSSEFGHLPGVPWWALVGVQVLGATSLFARRSAPLTVAVANAALSVVTATAAAAPATYAAVAYGVRPLRIWAVTLAMVVIAARPWQLELSRADDGDLTVDLQLMLVAVATATLLGLRRRRARSREARAARDRALAAEQARADERARLAAEMHDVITHRVSLMVLQAGALQVSATDDGVRRQADELRRSGRQALGELRELLSVIREEPAEPEHRAELAVLDLADLIAASRGVGVPVELVTDGPPTPMSTVVVRTAYRVVQESLTNIRKHAPGAAVRLSVRYDHDSLRLSIRNSAPAEPDGPDGAHLSDTGASGGLHGLRRRVQLVDGNLHAGPRPGGGFEVSAVLPTGGG